MTTTVFLVRHGAHDQLGEVLCGRTPGVALGREGRAQSRAIARRLRRADLAGLFTSPLERTRQTAAIVERLTGVRAQAEPALNEVDFGDWNGARFCDLKDQAAWRTWNEHRSGSCAPGGESAQAVRARIGSWLEAVAHRHDGQAVAAVSHADVIKLALGEVLGLSPDHHQQFEISPGSISCLAIGRWGAKVLSINEAPR